MKPFVALAFLLVGVSCNTLRLVTPSYGVVDSYGPIIRNIPIVSLTHDIRGSLSDQLQYETGNGILVADNTQVVSGLGGVYEDEYGKLVQSDQLIQKSGSYSFTTPEGQMITTSWVADENGFHVQGDHLPQPVPLPLEHAEAHRIALIKDAEVRATSYDAPALHRVEPTTIKVIKSTY